MDNEQIIRNAYEIEVKDSEGWLAAFTSDGTFTDESIGVTYRGRSRLIPVENYGWAFSDMHRDRSGTSVHDGLVRVMDKILRDFGIAILSLLNTVSWPDPLAGTGFGIDRGDGTL